MRKNKIIRNKYEQGGKRLILNWKNYLKKTLLLHKLEDVI